MARNLKPVSIAGIEGDALISEDISYSADIPEYPVENGYNVSDTIILKPIQLSITLYINGFVIIRIITMRIASRHLLCGFMLMLRI